MSRLGKLPVAIPSGVQANIKDGVVTIQGPQGSLTQPIGHGIEVALEDGNLQVRRVANDKQARANYGTMRALLANMVHGVSEGWKRSLELQGVGYNASMQGQTLVLNVGLSHQVQIEIPKEIKTKVAKTRIDLESPNKQLLGTVAAKIRNSRPPEPYLGKGVRIVGEQVRRKAGKAGK